MGNLVSNQEATMLEQKEVGPANIIGVMGVATFFDQGVYAGHREKYAKLWCGKEEGDVGFTGGGIAGETPIEALKRELKEEWGLSPVDQDGSGHYVIGEEPYGYWETKEGWVVVYVVLINRERVNGETFGPKDEETDCPSLFSAAELKRFNVRMGFEAVVAQFERGNRGFRLSLDEVQGAHTREGRVPVDVIYVADQNGREETRQVRWTTITL